MLERGGGCNCCITALIYVSATTLVRHPYVICIVHAVKVACVVNNGAKMAAERKPIADIYSFNQPLTKGDTDTENPLILDLMAETT